MRKNEEADLNPYQPPQSPLEPVANEQVRRHGPPRPAGAFSVTCTCGRAIAVAASQAGSTVRCDCGADIRVPSLSRLRESVGQDRYESSKSDTIRRMIKTGELPGSGPCAVSRKPTDDVIELDIVVPRYFKTDVNTPVIPVFFFGWFPALLLAVMSGSEFQEDGASTVRVALKVANRYHPKVEKMSQRRLRRLLRTVAIYGELLDENPLSRIRIAKL